jgi:signal transduction histidine kinase
MNEFLSTNFTLVATIEVLGFLMGIWVYLNGKNNKINKFFSLMTFSILFWITAGYLTRLQSQNYLALLGYKLNMGIVTIFFIFAYFFSVYFPIEGKRYHILDKLIILINLFIAFIIISTNLVFKSVEFTNWGINFVFGKGNFIFYGMVYILTFFVFFNFYKKYFTLSKKDKLKSQYFLMGITIFAVLNLIFNVTIPLVQKSFKYYWIGDYSTIFLLAFTAYAIVKQNLFNIKAVLTAFFVGSIAILLGVDTFVFAQTPLSIISKTIILFAFLWFGYLLIRNVKREMERREVLERLTKELEAKTKDLQEKTKDLQSLLDITQVAASSLKTKEVTQEILNSIPKKLKHLEYIGGILTLRDERQNTLQAYAITKTKLIEKALKILNKPFRQYNISINNKHTLLLKTLDSGKIHTSDKIENFISPPVPKKLAQATQKIIGMKTGVGVPIMIRGKIAGVIMFALKRKIEQIDKRDKEIMTAFSNHLGITIENSRLFEEATDKRKKLEQANKKLVEIAEAKSNFLSIASHQLRTPVSIAKGMLAMLVDKDVPKEKQTQFIQRSFSNLERLSDIIHDLLSASAIEGTGFKLNKKKTQINDIINKVLEERTAKAKAKKLNLIYNKPQTPIKPFKMDDNKMMEVIANLVDNSIQYTLKGKIEIETKIKNNNFVFKIKDTGIGIKEKNMPKLFKKISRLPNAVNIRPNGTGLGLYLVKKIVQAHGGKVDVKSSGVNGQGSEFRFWLPMR